MWSVLEGKQEGKKKELFLLRAVLFMVVFK